VRQRTGRFEDADGGTLFLDEIAETSQGVQAKLLRALEERKFERLGSGRSISVDVRIIVATKRDLEVEVAGGRFRDDLYYRLKVVPIPLPPLRDREGDVALLAQAFAHRYGAERGRSLAFSSEALEALSRHPLPGNVRELQHLVQRLAVVCPAETLLLRHLPEDYASGGRPRVQADPTSFEGSLSEMMAAFERLVLKEALGRYGGHRGNAAKALGISRKNLWEKLKLHGLEE
jgi:two-component system response regulator AtoC